MKSANRTLLTVTEVELRIVPDATATLLPETIGSTSTTATTLQYVDDPSHPVTATTLGFTDDPTHPVAATPANAAIPPTLPTPTPTPTPTAPPADNAASPGAFDWIDALSDDQIAYLLSLSDADLAAVLFGPIAPESPATPVAGPILPADITVTLHGVDVGTRTTPPSTGSSSSYSDLLFREDPNAPPPTATTLEFTNGQQGQGPLVTTLQNPVQAPQMTSQEALNRLQNRPQIIVDSSTPPVVQTAAAPVTQAGVPTSIRPGNEWIYNTTANGMFVPFMTKTAYAAMITAGNIANGSTSSGWTFGATFGPTISEIGNLINYAPTIITTEVMMWQLQQAVTIHTNYTTVRNNSDENQVGSAILAVLGYAGAPVNDGLVHVGNQVSTIYNEQRSSGADIAGSASTTFVYSLGSVVGLVDIHEAIEGREARSGRELTSNERWSRAFLGVGSFLLSLAPLLPSGRAAAAAGATADTAAGRAALEADVRASLQAAQAERRATALSRGERQAMVPERPAGPPGEGPVPRPEPVPRPPVVPESVVPSGPTVSQPVVDAVGQARSTAGGVAGDCENAVLSLRESLPGGTSRRLSVGEIGFHQVYIHEGRVIDAVAAQYVRNAAMLQQVEQAGLRAAMESGVFTVEEHIQFMRIVRGEQFTIADYLPRGL